MPVEGRSEVGRERRGVDKKRLTEDWGDEHDLTEDWGDTKTSDATNGPQASLAEAGASQAEEEIRHSLGFVFHDGRMLRRTSVV